MSFNGKTPRMLVLDITSVYPDLIANVMEQVFQATFNPLAHITTR